PLKSGRAADSDQSFLWPAGTCLAAQPFGPVPCDRPHRYEVTGAVDLTGRAAEPSPGEWEEIGWRGPCVQRAAEYLGRPLAAGGGVATTVLRLEPASWAAGSRQATCVIGRSDGKGTPVDSTGSVRG
ncbi:MAG TPA: septum formation family protein, partial [Acidimicrobiales bacterium]|nr:septum formation family protein [Acidimicrobiales bacterium]